VKQDQPFDAVVLMAFGGPGGMNDVRPFLMNVVSERRVPSERLEELARRYELFGGVSPMTQITLRQAAGLTERLKSQGINLPVHVGMRHWRPYIQDALTAIAAGRGRRAIGFITAAHHSYVSCTQYKKQVAQARRALLQASQPDVAVTYVDSWFDHELLIRAWAQQVHKALDKLEPTLRHEARLVFTAHSIPLHIAQACQYRQQLAESARLVAQAVGRTDWALVYQSRSGPPSEPWLEPEVCAYLMAERARDLRAAVLVPIGFISDHVEVLYDLDHEAARLCRQHNLPMVRAESLNDHPLLLDMMAEVVAHTWHHHRDHLALPVYCPL